MKIKPSTTEKNEQTPARVRLVDVAREAGVSPAVATKVLTGCEGNIRVSEATARRVSEAARRMNYRQNRIASALGGGKSYLIGVYIDSFAPETDFRVLACLEQGLTRLNYRLLVAESHDDMNAVVSSCAMFQEYGVEGVIVISHTYTQVEPQRQGGWNDLKHVIFIGHPLETTGVPYVDIDWGAGVAAGVRHLIERKKRRLGIILDAKNAVSLNQRLAGFREATGSAILECALVCRLPEGDREAALAEACDTFVRANALDGIILQNDLHAAFMLGLLQDRGIRVPDEIAVIGHNNMNFCTALRPTLTTIDDQCAEIAEKAIELLMRQFSDPKETPDTPPLVLPRLVVRRSS